MWTTVSDASYDHERAALAWLRSRLPEREPYHVWANFEFTTLDGQLYEVDALAITDNGVHLIEIKSFNGTVAGDAATWELTSPSGKFRQIDNPRILANRKAKKLKSLVEKAKAFSKSRGSVPYVDACVFLSDPTVRSELTVQGRHNIFGRDAERDDELPSERAALGGILEHLTTLGPVPSGRRRRLIDRPIAAKLVKAIGQIGIRERSSRREVSDYRIERLLHDVEADTTDSVSYQDFLGRHRSVDLERKLRVYPLEHNATAEQREAAHRAAVREFEMLRPLHHSGILRPHDFAEHERGPVLIFDYDPAEVPLPAWLADPAKRQLPVETRLAIVRDIVEAVAFANSRGVFHRALCPSAILVAPSSGAGAPHKARITNWHTGARTANDSSRTLLSGTVHAHVEALAASDAPLYRAPEHAAPKARPARLDVFSLGALALFVLTGEPPARTPTRLRSMLDRLGCLDPSAAADGMDPGLVELIVSATRADPSHRVESAQDFLEMLDVVEQEWAAPDETGEAHPLEARRGAVLGDGRLEVLSRLGRGSTAVALLVKDNHRFGQLCVAKIANDPSCNDRLLSEAAALEGLQHQAIAALLDDHPLDLSGHTAILLGYAGPRTDRSKLESRAGHTQTDDTRAEPEGRTLASRLRDGPVGAELAQRWGEDLLDALRYLEEMGRPHRDIKPDNLGVAPRGSNDELHLMLFDFSLASAPVNAIEAGTPAYSDPFLARRGRWDPAADRYSASVTLFEMVTGERPRYGDGSADPVMVDDDAAVEPRMFDAAAAEGLTRFFRRALRRETAERFGDADEMYWAWHEAFASAGEPSTPSVEPVDDDREVAVPAGTGRESPLASLPLSRRAVSALERCEILTVGKLLDQSLMTIRTLPGVGATTRAEIVAARNHLDHHFGVPTSDPSGAATAELTEVIRDALPSSMRGEHRHLHELARVLAGLDPDCHPWAPQRDLASRLAVGVGRVSQLMDELRDRWRRDSGIHRLRVRVQSELGRLRIVSVDQVAGRLLSETSATRSSSAENMRLALGAVRIATLAEEGIASAGWMMSRRGSAVLVAARSDDGAPHSASELADYAALLADAAEGLVNSQRVVSRHELLDRLDRVVPPTGTVPLPGAHLADLVADLCASVAVNSRLELYPVGLAPVEALRAARRSLVTAQPITVSEIRSRVSARFPQAGQLPGRPELDEAFKEAGVELDWSESDSAYISPQHRARTTSTVVDSSSRYPTRLAASIPEAEIDNAADFHDRLHRARNNGSLLVLVTEARELDKAERQIGGLGAATVNLDEWLSAELAGLTANGKPSWDTLAAADAAGPGGVNWGRLRQVVDQALERVTDRLLATNDTVLLTNVGLLARYDRLDLVAAWRGSLHMGGHPLRAIWLLIPSTVASDVPMLDHRAVPVVSRNEWSRIPADWLKNAHRGARTPSGSRS